MATATRKLSDEGQRTGWLVRNEQGETFGPVDVETLKGWACDGRLAPTNEVSENGSAWQLVTAVRGLEMDWVAEVTPGTFYGPIHKRAIEELVKDGSITAQAEFFARRALAEVPPRPPDEGQARRVAELTEELARARQAADTSETHGQRAAQEAAACREQLREARQQATDSRAELERAQRQASESRMELERAQRQATESRTELEQARRQLEALSAEVRQMRLEASAAERQLRQQLAEQEEQAQRRVAAYEEQVRLAQQQVAAYAAQMEQVRQTAASAEAHLNVAVRQMSEQAEQARAAQQQLTAKAGEFARELEAVRKEQAATQARLSALQAERAAGAAALDAQGRAFAAERQELQAALSHAQAETSLRDRRLSQLEAALVGVEGADAERVVLESRVMSVNAELAGVRQALAGEKDAARQAEARCATLEAALEEAKALRSGGETSLSEMGGQLRQLQQQLGALDAWARKAFEARETREDQPGGGRAPEPPRERVYVEVEPVEVLPPERAKAPVNASPEPERLSQDKQRKPADPPPAASSGRAPSGLSLAELEQQARRELERLGSQGANLFKRKK